MADDTSSGPGYLRREVPGLACLFLAAIIGLALVSYHPADPSFLKHSTIIKNAPIHNYIGLIGAYLSALSITVLGLASFWFVLVLGLLSVVFFRGQPVPRSWLPITGLVLLLLSGCSFLGLVIPKLSGFWPGATGGGLLGSLLAGALVSALGAIGAWLVILVLGLLAIILTTGWSLTRGTTTLWAAIVAVKSKVTLLLTKRREQADRSRRLQEALDKNKERVEPKVKEKVKTSPKPRQEVLEFLPPEVSADEPVTGPYQLPSPELLDKPEKSQGGLSRDSLMANARLLEKKLADFNVQGEVVEVATGPVITMYEYQPAPGVKISKVAGLADDLALNLRALAIRIVAPLPGKAAIGIEIPNPKREFVALKEVISAPVFEESKSLLTLVLGVDIMGQPVVADLTRMPHLLIAGATGSGKSVGLNAIIMSMLYKARPDQVRFLMIDPKRIELALYRDLPHLIYPVISEPKDANQALKWAVADMEHRYQLLAEKGVRNIESYNRKVLKERETMSGSRGKPAKNSQPLDSADEEPGETASAAPALPEPLPYLVIIIDELADLMMVAAKEVETSITRLAQMARAAGIHLILATQRPSVDVLTGVIKANLPTRISFQVSSKIDSRTIIDTMGAEKLLGAGDMLYLPPGTAKLMRIHGAYVSEPEIKRVTGFIKTQQAPEYLEDLEVAPLATETGETEEDHDEKYQEAVALVTRTGKASISLIQRHLRIGYNRAARIIEIMEREGVVGPADGARPREVLVRD